MPSWGCRCWAGEGASSDPAPLPLPEKRVPLRILYENYRENLTQDNLIKVVALLTEYQTGDVIVAIRDVYIQNPEIKIRVRAQLLCPGWVWRGHFPFPGGSCNHPGVSVPVI